MLSNKSLIIHSYSVALVLEFYATILNEDKDTFYITGLLHDADYERYPNEHPNIIVNKLKEKLFGELKKNKSFHDLKT